MIQEIFKDAGINILVCIVDPGDLKRKGEIRFTIHALLGSWNLVRFPVLGRNIFKEEGGVTSAIGVARGVPLFLIGLGSIT